LFKGQGQRGLGRGWGCLMWHSHPQSLFPCSAREGGHESAALWAKQDKLGKKELDRKKTAQRDRTESRARRDLRNPPLVQRWRVVGSLPTESFSARVTALATGGRKGGRGIEAGVVLDHPSAQSPALAAGQATVGGRVRAGGRVVWRLAHQLSMQELSTYSHVDSGPSSV